MRVQEPLRLETILTTLSDVVWGPPLLALLVGTGIFLTLRLRGVQFTTLVPSLRLALVVRDETGGTGDVSHYQALMTALAATVGTGNIAGVATGPRGRRPRRTLLDVDDRPGRDGHQVR